MNKEKAIKLREEFDKVIYLCEQIRNKLNDTDIAKSYTILKLLSNYYEDNIKLIAKDSSLIEINNMLEESRKDFFNLFNCNSNIIMKDKK